VLATVATVLMHVQRRGPDPLPPEPEITYLACHRQSGGKSALPRSFCQANFRTTTSCSPRPCSGRRRRP
jgi:hypothetical protein